MKNFTFILLLFLLLAGSSCKTARRAQGVSLKPKSDKVLMKRLLENQVNAGWFGARAKITYKDEYGRESVSANIRIRKDSVIWMNFKKFSIEGARVLITPDSVYVVDRINGEYAVKSFEAVQKEYHLPVGFQGLQALLLGNPVFFSDEMEAGTDSSHYILTQKTDRVNAKYWLTDPEMLLHKFFVEDFSNRRNMSVLSAGYESLEDKQKFSYLRTIQLSSPDMGEMTVDIEFSKVEVNVPQSVKFEIPEQYERVD